MRESNKNGLFVVWWQFLCALKSGGTVHIRVQHLDETEHKSVKQQKILEKNKNAHKYVWIYVYLKAVLCSLIELTTLRFYYIFSNIQWMQPIYKYVCTYIYMHMYIFMCLFVIFARCQLRGSYKSDTLAPTPTRPPFIIRCDFAVATSQHVARLPLKIIAR